MEPRVHVLTLGVRDLAAARRFYVDGLGWPPLLEVPGEVVFLQVGHGLLLSLFDGASLAAEAGLHPPHAGQPAPLLSLGHNVDTEDAVADVLRQAEAAGGVITAGAQRRSWGGVSGYFADPDGIHWEVAHNPGLTVAADGRVLFAPAPD